MRLVAADGPCKSRCQIRGLLLVALLLSHEVQAVVNASRPVGIDNIECADEDCEGTSLADSFARPADAVTSLAHHSGAALRSLALTADWTWAANTELKIWTRNQGDDLVYETRLSSDQSTTGGRPAIIVCANLMYVGISITEEGKQYDAEYDDSAIKLVQPHYDRTRCSSTTFDVGMGTAQNGAATQSTIESWLGINRRRRNGGALALVRSNQTDGRLETDRESKKMIFMQGGTYLLCYTPDYPFGGDDTSVAKEHIVPVDVKVLGVKSPCADDQEDGCINNERWECYFGFKGESLVNCEFNFKADSGSGWGITSIPDSKMTWGAAYGPDTVVSGALSAMAEQPCQTVANVDNFDYSSIYLDVDRTTPATMPPVKPTRKEAFTVAACYCPNYDHIKGSYCAPEDSTNDCMPCDDPTDFIQFFGRIYYWSVRICDAGPSASDYTNCNTPYMRAIPQQKFVLRVDCPPGGGCLNSADNRVKFLMPNAANDQPNWHPNHGCKMTIEESPYAVWPSLADSRTVDGGDRVDYKIWRTKMVKINLSVKKTMDICFANENSVNPNSWFRIGQVTTSTSFSLASRAGESSSLFHLKYVDEPGTIALYGGERTRSDAPQINQQQTTATATVTQKRVVPSPFDGNKYSGKALLNIISYDRETGYGGTGPNSKTLEAYLSDLDLVTPDDTLQQEMDAQCQRERYEPSLVLLSEGTWNKQNAKRVMAQADPGGSQEQVNRYLKFIGTSSDSVQALRITKSGVVALCYCAIIDSEDACLDPGFWIFVGMTTVRGPIGDRVGSNRWSFDTDIVVNMRIEGWGFSGCDPTKPPVGDDCLAQYRDKLRIISDGVCTDAGGSPTGSDAFRVDCPAMNGNGCTPADATTDIKLNADTALNQNAFITAISVGAKKTTLTFSKDIAGIFQDGDHITIDKERVIIDGTPYGASLTDNQQFDLYKLTGLNEFRNDPSEEYWLSQKVTLVTGGTQVNQVTIPVGWNPPSDAPVFTLQDGLGYWKKRNRVYTNIEIKGKPPKDRVQGVPAGTQKVCWGVFEGVATKYYAQAGEIEFVDPYSRPSNDPNSATVSLTTHMNGAIAPVVLTFQTSDLDAYKYPPGVLRKTQLMIRFLDIASDGNGQLVPRYSQDSNPSGIETPSPYADDEEVTRESMKQWVCGRLFVELWAEDEDGFPLPAGCYYGKKYKDAPLPNVDGEDPFPEPTFYREFFIVFGEGSGLRAVSKYQIVLNAEVTNVVPDKVLIDMYAMCAEENCELRPYQVFEKIPVHAAGKLETGATYLTMQPPAAGSEHQWGGSDAFFIQRGDPSDLVLKLHEENILQVKLKGGDGATSIQREQIIRVYLFPTTLWDVGGANCNAYCVPYHASFVNCNGAMGCSTDSVVGTAGRRNIIKITLPTDMDDITGSVQHTILVSGLTLPVYGFFPTRLGAELRDVADQKPTYTTSTGFVMNDPIVPTTSGMLVLDDRTGYGPKPFSGQNGNILYVRIQFGATLWHNGETDAAYFYVDLPKPYTCSVPEGDDGQAPTSLAVFQVDNVDPVGYIDNMRGVLSVATTDGDYANSMLNRCVYTLRDRMAIFAKQVAYMKFTVNNPDTPLAKLHEDNKWSVTLNSKGMVKGTEHPSSMAEVPFITLGEEKTMNGDMLAQPMYWGSNAAVLSRIDDEDPFLPVIQPGDFRASCCGGSPAQVRTNYMRIFFHTTQSVGRGGYVIVDAPDTFDFDVESGKCDARDLPESYYAFIGLPPTPQLTRLRDMGPCTPAKYPHLTAQTNNRAILKVPGTIDGDKWYGFELAVKHPVFYDISHHMEWYMFTENSNRYPIEGTEFTVRFNRQQAPPHYFYHKSWGMLYDIDNVMQVEVVNTQITGTWTDVIFFPVAVNENLGVTDTSLRITAPDGYIWDDREILGTTYSPTTNGTTLPFEPMPQVKNGNQLVWESVALTGRDAAGPVRYGFRHKVKLPNWSPVTSSNSFFIEWGFQQETLGPNPGERIKAAVIQAPMVSALTNAVVAYATNLRAWENNYMEFHVQTVTTLYADQAIVIRGDPNTAGFQFSDTYVVLDGSSPLPQDARVIPQINSATSLPEVILKAVTSPIPPGFYKIEVPTVNPNAVTPSTSTPGRWLFGSYKLTNGIWTEQSEKIDEVITAPGFRINDKMADARLIDPIPPQVQMLIGTNYRPGKPNQLIFRFRLGKQVADVRDMIIRGPRGFVFDEDCHDAAGPHRIVTDKADVFGSEAQWDPQITEWFPNLAPTACVGNGRQATVTIPVGLQRYNYYAFRIGVRQNPMTTPFPWNKWSIDFNGETSEPFDGFTIWTNTGMKVTPSTNASSPASMANAVRTINPVEITFQPQNSIPFKAPEGQYGGSIRLTAPTGFEIAETNGECKVLLQEQGGITFNPDTDLRCTVSTGEAGSRRQLELEIVGDKAVEKHRMYIMIVEVYNPENPQPTAEQWAMYSYDTNQEPLDESYVKGFSVNNVLNTFDVRNPDNEFKGKAKVDIVDITMEFPDPIKDDDIIQMYAPLNFDIQGNPDILECNEFAWRGTSIPFPTTDKPKCMCSTTADGSQCWLWWNIRENNPGSPALRENVEFSFKIATENPDATPFVTNNFWRVSHLRAGEVKSSHVFRSWDIRPQLEDVRIELIGAGRAAGSESDLQFTFTPVSDAFAIKIEAAFPTDFSFDTSRVDVPMDIDKRSESNTIIINRVQIVAGARKDINIYSVRLGRGGGQTRFNIATYSAQLPTDVQEWADMKMDEKDGFTDGFRLPGKIDVSGQELKSRYREEQQLYPVKSLFQPRVDEDAKAEFTIRMTQPVRASEKLIIACEGDGAYTLKASPFVLIGTGQVPTTTELAENGELQATLKPGRPSSEIALQADTPYKVIVQVIPRAGTNTWWFSTFDGQGAYPTNTNDGETSGFSPVEKMEVVVQTTRSPPGARVDVTLNVQQGSAVIRELLIIAPPRFIFPSSGCGNMCRAGQALGSTGRRTATLASPGGEPLTNLNGLAIKVITPEQSPEDLNWYVEGRAQGGAGTTTGWGQGAGFMINQMARSSVMYPGVANLKSAQIAFTFSMDVNAGSQIEVVPPTGYLLTCSTEGALRQISLPGNIPDCVDDPLELILTRTLTAGDYSFGLAVDVPPQTPEANTFDIIIKNQENQVVDAAFGIPGQAIDPELQVSNPTLSWSRSEPGVRSIITFGLTFNQPTTRIKAVLLNFPDKFIHDVQRPTDVVNLNKRFKVAAGSAGDWADTQYTDRLKIYLDDSDPTTTIAAGTYTFNFPAKVPCCTQDDMPKNNVWFLSLCEDRSCGQPGDSTIIVTLPMAGFALNELAPEALRSPTNAARQRSPLVGPKLCTLVALFAQPLAAMLQRRYC